MRWRKPIAFGRRVRCDGPQRRCAPAAPATPQGSDVIRWTYAFIDRPRDRFERGVEFWAAVTGTRLSALRGEHSEFATLLPEGADACLKVQAVGDGGGVHMDLCTEDWRAFARMAVDLGASVVAELDGLCVLRSPAGLAFCAVQWHGESTRPEVVVAPDGSRSRVDQVCIDVAPGEYDAEVAFWARLTGWQVRDSVLPEFKALRPPDGLPIRILLQRLNAARPTSAHLDLACSDREATRADHERRGAAVVDRRPRWIVMRDPAGCVYCLTIRDPQTGTAPGTPDGDAP